jgi:hypothetical protein
LPADLETREANHMKCRTVYSMLAVAGLFASTELAAAQGTSGGTGAIASIPGSVVRAEPGQPAQLGLIGILTNPPQSNTDTRRGTTRRGESPPPR